MMLLLYMHISSSSYDMHISSSAYDMHDPPPHMMQTWVQTSLQPTFSFMIRIYPPPHMICCPPPPTWGMSYEEQDICIRPRRVSVFRPPTIRPCLPLVSLPTPSLSSPAPPTSTRHTRTTRPRCPDGSHPALK